MSKNVSKLQLLLLCLLLCSIPIKTTDEFNNSSTNNQTEEACLQESCETIPKEDNVTDVGLANNFLHEQTIEILNERVIPWHISNSICPIDRECHSLPADCIICKFNFTCIYGNLVNVSCQAIPKCDVCITKANFNYIFRFK
jgi:hypothetical protein